MEGNITYENVMNFVYSYEKGLLEKKIVVEKKGINHKDKYIIFLNTDNFKKVVLDRKTNVFVLIVKSAIEKEVKINKLYKVQFNFIKISDSIEIIGKKLH